MKYTTTINWKVKDYKKALTDIRYSLTKCWSGSFEWETIKLSQRFLWSTADFWRRPIRIFELDLSIFVLFILISCSKPWRFSIPSYSTSSWAEMLLYIWMQIILCEIHSNFASILFSTKYSISKNWFVLMKLNKHQLANVVEAIFNNFSIHSIHFHWKFSNYAID